MKYLEKESTGDSIGSILEVEKSTPGLTILLETYSLKMTKKEKKITRTGKYKSISSMVTAGLNLLFSDYDISINFRDLKVVTQEEFKIDLTNQLFTLGITKNFIEMKNWVENILEVIKECAGEDLTIIKVSVKKGPFERCHWSFCVAAHGKVLKRVVLFVVLYSLEKNFR